MKCPTLNELSDYKNKLLIDAESAAIHSHITGPCENCLANLRWLDEVSLLTGQDRSFDFPEETIKNLVAWFKSQPPHAPLSLRQLVAKLTFDSLWPNQLAPVRAAAQAGQSKTFETIRQMLFQTDGYDIDLRFETIEGSQVEDLIGQILPHSESEAIPAGVTIQLWSDKKERASAITDNHGLFRFARIPILNYDLKIQFDDIEIEIINPTTPKAS